MKKTLVLLAEGVEEMEGVITVDVLRRAGVQVTAAAIGDTLEVIASRGMKLVADERLENVQPDDFDALVLPGGAGGSRRLAADVRVLELIQNFVAEKKLVAAVCAAPLALQAAGALKGRRFTCHPGVCDQFAGMQPETARVVEDGMLITSQGPGTSMEFALAIARRLVGAKIAEDVATGLILPAGVQW
jgi:DJ-1 family protein